MRQIFERDAFDCYGYHLSAYPPLSKKALQFCYNSDPVIFYQKGKLHAINLLGTKYIDCTMWELEELIEPYIEED